jgi:hypothetical protein
VEHRICRNGCGRRITPRVADGAPAGGLAPSTRPALLRQPARLPRDQHNARDPTSPILLRGTLPVVDDFVPAAGEPVEPHGYVRDRPLQPRTHRPGASNLSRCRPMLGSYRVTTLTDIGP